MVKWILLISALFSGNVMAQENFQVIVNDIFGAINGAYAPFLFWEVPFIKLPLILFIMVSGGIFFTFRYGFVNIRLFKHGIDVVRGKYDDPEHEGDISHFQALTSALSATVGLGNIAGVAVAIGAGGPGAVFWLWVVAFFGMSMKFSSCTFAQFYRIKDSNGNILGGPMVYLTEGLKERGFSKLAKVFGIFFSFATILASFGGGNLFQANQTFEIIKSQYPGANPWVVGVTLAFLAGVVLIGGIKRIGEVTSKLVPLMCGFFVISCLAIIFSNISMVPEMFVSIFREAFSPDAIYGGFLGVLIQGVKRASFSNEAGLGSAAIAHAAAKTDEPVREGVVAMLGPVIDTHIVCTMTALTILITGAHLQPELVGKGVEITSYAFGTLGSFMPKLLLVAICVFAYSTVISWSYYGERATEYLFGKTLGHNAIRIYRLCYVFIIILGPVLSIGNVVDFADLMLLSMAFPNILGMIYLSKLVKDKTDDYFKRYKSGSMKIYK
ncbi:sodium:alanine symporter family protein [Bacteriovorax sp. Seq25_V]|uniref:alanine/glycine:cation symporter family protein n=1 Tax=Bacteriovorax sp. Seq25_V TaxID=1201288 RepID=UPI000389F2A0|nr:alanine/glycine:cation symporter family protein [Bacteriovorax sp. Seq25_V]EQC47690.1 amino acid carrier protein [Bacteriovorax sp. Seq25_V]